MLFRSLFDDDVKYLIERSRFFWGDFSDNLVNKLNQYEEIATVPVFEKLIVNEFFISTAFLEYIRPNCLKSIFNKSIVTNNPNNVSIVIPLHVPNLNSGNVSYQFYNQEKLSQFTELKDSFSVVEELSNAGADYLEYSETISTDTPLIINTPGVWSGISNLNTDDYFICLRLSLGGNPNFDSVVSVFNH